MLIYNLIVFSHLLFFKSRSRLLILVSFICLVFISGYRSIHVGTDTLNYYLGFQQYLAGAEMRHEPLWYLLSKAVIFIGGDFDALKLSAAFLTLLPFYIGITKASKWPVFSIFIFLTFYYYFYSFNIVRQCLAMTWSFLGIVYYGEEKGKAKCWAFLVIGILFHYTALLVPILLVFYRLLRDLRINFLFIQLVTIFIGVGLGSYLVVLARVFFSDYSDLAETDTSLVVSLVNVLVLNIAFYIVNAVSRNRDRWFYFFFFFIVITNLIIRVPFGNRFIIYAGICLTIFLANVMDYVRLPKRISPLIYILIVSYCLFRFFRIVGAGEILPYENVLLEIS